MLKKLGRLVVGASLAFATYALTPLASAIVFIAAVGAFSALSDSKHTAKGKRARASKSDNTNSTPKDTS